MTMIEVRDVHKTFTLYNQGAARIAALHGVSLGVAPGECVGLTGASGSGKSTLMRLIWGNYLAASGSIRVWGTEIVGAAPRQVPRLRGEAMSHVSQFLRVVPRVPARDVVAEPLRARRTTEAEARTAAEAMLNRLRVPRALWDLSPTTFSGGEQQRVNIAHGFIRPTPVMLVDEPTASLDAVHRETVLSLIEGARDAGAAILGIFHDDGARGRVCDRLVDLAAYRAPVSA